MNLEKNELVSKILENLKTRIQNNEHIQKLEGVCNCGYKGKFEYIGYQENENQENIFSLYNCEKCGTTISAETLLNKKYRTSVGYGYDKK